MIYYTLATVWVVLSILIGLYINSYKLNGRTHFKLGLVTLGIAYLAGICLLITAINYS